MYSESDIEAAVAAGAMDARAAAGLRAFVAANRAAPAVDEESFRLVTGFNDIFVSIAAILLLVAVAWIGGTTWSPLAGGGVTAAAWGLAEYFTRRRRMALPSILLLLAFVGGLFAAVMALVLDPGQHSSVIDVPWERTLRTTALAIATAGGVAVAGAVAHWRRFHVPITIAAGAAAAVALVVSLAISALPAMAEHARALTFAGGIIVFLVAMRWDMSDPSRTTRRADVAFWLHLLAAPLIVHPVFTGLGLPGEGAATGAAGLVLLLYLVLGCVALAIDRRALMVSALAYVLFALSDLFRQYGAVGLNVAFTALLIGSALLLLSAYWQSVRRAVVGLLPRTLAERLPPVRTLTPPRAS